MPVHSFKTYNGLDRCCRIYDMKGALMKSFDITDGKSRVVADLSSGTYMVMIQTPSNRYTYKIVVL